LATAASTNRPVLVHFYGDHCPPCLMLEKKAFKDAKLIESMNANVIAVRINADRDRATARKYQVNRWPTDVYLFPNGQEIDRGVSNQDAAVYAKTVERIAVRHRDWTLEQVAKREAKQQRDKFASKTNPSAVKTRITTDDLPKTAPVRVHSSAWSQPAPAAPSLSELASQKMQPSATPSTLVSSPASSLPTPSLPTASLPTPSLPTPSLPTPSLPTASMPSLPAVAPAPPPAVAQAPSTPLPAPSAPMAAAPMAAAPMAAASSVPAPAANAPASDALKHAAQLVGLESHPGLGGFCPVSLRDSIEASRTGVAKPTWVRGSAAFGVRHRGRVYHCSSESARQRLLQDPDQYAPILSGCDLVEFARSGDLIDGNCQFGFIEEKTGRVFLFASKANYEEFSRNCGAYSPRVDEPKERVASEPTRPLQR
jgi:thiol-disulfide isomerase/thioredoxin/YHS domain-containing protein